MHDKELQELRCFVSIPDSSVFEPIKKVIIDVATESAYQVVSSYMINVKSRSIIQEEIIGEIARSNLIIADVSGLNPNILFELGLAKAMGKGILLISEEKFFDNVLFDIHEFSVITYSYIPVSFSILSEKIKLFLEEFRRFPVQKSSSSIHKFSSPFSVDWDRLSDRDVENLCAELLAQMGFHSLEWEKVLPDNDLKIDLITEFPKKDPDGYEYRELWLVSMGLRVPAQEYFDIVFSRPGLFLYLLSTEIAHFKERVSYSSITFLLLSSRKGSDNDGIEALRERVEELYKRGGSLSNVRLRIWDRDYLTSLVQKFPGIGYKYFSDEGRLRSETRKSYEELYFENSKLSERQAKLIMELEEEKNKRIRAERDSVWKDISFSAAHKIGNPIFAIETGLGPLLKRISEGRKDEAVEVVDNIRSAVEKAKAFIDQLKSLSKAQEIKPVPTPILPILEDACKQVSNHGVDCKIECPSNITVQADPDKLAECFDELVMNTIHWFDKPEKKIEITVTSPATAHLPDFLDTTQKYFVIHVRDNGRGIAIQDKNRIFDAFFTTYDHGTGLGLAVVRRIIDGHGGGIIESGIPGDGADFEVYLPLKEIKNA
ncbi:MAG: HAMP domain-containing histidine kinase [Nitrospirae bacterium]|nr:HAMP domain-containing histidine kinase [Nitrospirota bacterium]